MFGIGTPELVVIIIVGLIILGPNKLPEIMKSVGKGIAEFRRMSTDVKRTLETEIDRADQERRKEEAKRELFPDGVPEDKPRTAEAAPAASPAPTDGAARTAATAPAAGADATITSYPHEDAKAEAGKGAAAGAKTAATADPKGSKA